MTNRDTRRSALAAVAFVLGGAVPIQLVTLSFGYAEYFKGIRMGPRVLSVAHDFAKFYIPLLWIPAILILAGILLYSHKRYPDLFRRIAVGLAMGAIATLALDAVREAGVIHGWLPGDTPVMFGKVATGSNNFAFFYPVGLLVHYMNGANFGLFYSFVWGKRRSRLNAVFWAITWALVVELGMMLGPPMGPMVGPFGYNYAWPQFFILTFVAHVVFGTTLGLLIQHFLREEDRGGLITFLRGPGLTSG